MIRTIRIGAASLALALCAAPAAEAISVTFGTPSGSSVGDGPVSATAEFTIDPIADTIAIVLKNLQVNPKSVGTNLSDLFFTVSTGQTSASLLGSGGIERNVGVDGTFSDGAAPVAAGWALSNVGSRFHLDVLAGAGAVGPAHTILGPPDAGGVYSNANDSIAGNDPHNPFLAEQASFLLSIPGLIDTSTISEATFSFGTASGVEVTGTLVDVPEPTTMLLWATTLGGGALVRWRRSRRNAA